MFQFASIIICLFLFAVSLNLFSKSAEQRARTRTELYYASQIREEAEEIRLLNEKTKIEISNRELAKEGTIINNKPNIMNVSALNNAQEVLQQQPVKEIELKELELDEKAIEFISKFQPKQEEIQMPTITAQEESTTWFSFPEVDLHMNERPDRGLYYVAGKVIDVLDEMSAIISDGTGERMLYHHKVKNLLVGDIIISQVEIYKGVWNFVHVWEINESAHSEEKLAM